MPSVAHPVDVGPPTLSTHRHLRLLTLCALYVAQGIPWGFVAITLAALLADRGLGPGEIGGLLALSVLPWTFKWVWGPVIDRFGFAPMGRRRPWILLAQLLMALTIGAMIAVPDLTSLSRGVTLLAWMVFVHNCFSSLQDVAVDALAVDLLGDDERGLANGLMFGSKYLGGAIGGAGMATVVAHFGLRPALFLQVGALLAIMMLPLLLRERPGERLFPWSSGAAAPATSARAASSLISLFRDLGRAFSLRTTVFAAALALCAQIGAGVLAAVVSVYLIKHLGWRPESYAQIIGGPALIIGLSGSVLGGWLADRFGHKRMIALSAGGLGVVWFVFAAVEPWWVDDRVPTALLLIEPLLQSLATVSLFALFMDISWPRVAATQFTAYMACLNLSSAMGNWLAGALDQRLSVAAIFVVAGLIQLGVVALLLGIDPQQARRRFRA